MPCYEGFGVEFTVPLHARRLRRASVYWINVRWFLQRGIDTTNRQVRQSVCRWVLSEFGYAVPQPRDPVEAYECQEKTFYADRYGGRGIGANGGSGRSAAVGAFQVKGIGTTRHL